MPSAATSSMRPMNGDTMYAGISAARMACAGVNTSVTLIRMPSSVRCLPAVIPVGVIGTFTTTLSANVARCFPWSYIAFASGSVVSSETSPSTSSRIVRHAFSMSPCSRASNVGFVVTPFRTPQSLISRISSMLAVSRKSLIRLLPLELRDLRRFPLAPGSLRAPGHPLHDQVDDCRDGLVEVVVRDHRNAVGERLALDVLLHLPDVDEPSLVAVVGTARGVAPSDDEVAAMQVLVVDTDDHGDGKHLVVARLEVDEAGHDVGSFNDNRCALLRGTPDQGVDPHAHGGGLLAEPDHHLVRGAGWRLPERLVRAEARRVQGGHELLGEQPAHDLPDGVRGHEPHDPEPRGELGGDGGFPHARGAADHEDERDVERLYLLPPQEVLRVTLAGHLLQDAHRDGGELARGERLRATRLEHLLDPFRHLVGPERGQPGDHHARRHQALRVRKARLTIGDQDVVVLLAVLHRSSCRRTARSTVSWSSAVRFCPSVAT